VWGITIFPLYITILILSIIIYFLLLKYNWNWFILNNYIDNYYNIWISNWLFITFTQLFIFGQDIIMFLGINNWSFFFTNNFSNTSPILQTFSFIPQAWTISLELMFYIIAPLLIKNKFKFIFIIILLSILTRAYIYFILWWQHDPWIYRFFPTELTLFIFWIISYKIYNIIYKKDKYIFIWKILIFILFFMIIFSEIFNLSWLYNQLKNWWIYILTIFTIPFLFKFTKYNKFDKNIWELSYPIYLNHILIINILSIYNINDKITFLLVTILSIIMSIILIKFIDKPINSYRQKIVLKIN